MTRFVLERRVVRQVCDACGEILREGYRRPLEVQLKGAINLVTEVDHASEKQAVKLIAAAFPADTIVAEEGHGVDKGAHRRWFIDPLDGTTNFAHKYPVFCVSVGLESDGEIVFGAVYDPIRNEYFEAEIGHGATHNGQAIHVSQREHLMQALLASGFAYDIRDNPDNNLAEWNELLLGSRAVRRDGAAALDLCYVAMGRYDGYWERGLKPWDCAAGALIVQEAGGRVTDYAGGKYVLGHDQIAATCGPIHGELLAAIRRARDRAGLP